VKGTRILALKRKGACATMIHELLLAMVGCTGDVFIDTEREAQQLGRPAQSSYNEATNPASCPVKLAPDIDFVSQSER
jgi:gamma-tubulin complex component 4